MKKLLILFILLLPIFCFSEGKKYVTYFGGSRTGDQLVSYIHAKWVSYKWNMPLLYTPFMYSDQMVLHDVEMQNQAALKKIYTLKVQIKNLSQLDEKVKQHTLYKLLYFPDSIDEYKFLKYNSGPYVAIDWNDLVFRNLIRSLVKPLIEVPTVNVPKETVSVALHYRTGEKFDPAFLINRSPLKFPPVEYYVKQIMKVYELVNQGPMFIHIFTDHSEPEKLLKELQSLIPFENITFNCRTEHNFHDVNVLEDMFMMTQFDCLIRPLSNFSCVSSHLGDFKIDISPKTAISKNRNKWVIEEENVVQTGKWDPESKTWSCL